MIEHVIDADYLRVPKINKIVQILEEYLTESDYSTRVTRDVNMDNVCELACICVCVIEYKK